MSADSLQVQLLVDLAAEAGGRALSRFRTQRTGALLAFLAYHPGRAHSRESLCELLWPQEAREAAGASLSTALWWLRRELSALSAEATQALIADRATVSLQLDPCATDVARFECALAQAEQRGGEGRVEALRRACSLYRGELLPGYFDEWVLIERRRLAARHFQAARDLIHALAREGVHSEALGAAIRLVGLEPFREESHYELIRAYLSAGQPAAAANAYRELEAMLQREYNSRPSAVTQSLLRGDAGVPVLSMVNVPAPAEGLEHPPGGAMPIASPFYLERDADRRAMEAIDRRESFVLVKGARQMGKSSLLARALAHARAAGAQVMTVDFEGLSPTEMESPDSLYRSLANRLALQLDPDSTVAVAWTPERSPGANFERFIRRQVPGGDGTRMVWALDGVDRLFTSPFGTEVFRLLRSWHNARALEPQGPWSRLTLLIAYATEVSRFIQDANQSPFNVGTHLVLEELTVPQVEQMNERFGQPLHGPREIQRFIELVGGHPFLVHCGLHHLKSSRSALAQIEAQADRDEGPFGRHLRSVYASATAEERLAQSVRRLVAREGFPSPEDYYRLRSAGILTGDSEQAARLRCALYERYFARHLGVSLPGTSLRKQR